MTRGFRFAEYRYFFEVANQRSIRKAAQVLHISPSAVSRQIQKIEYLLGFEVIERSSEGVRLTLAGEEFLNHIRQSFASEERLFARLDEISGLQRGHVRIVSGDSFLPDLLGPAFQNFAEKYPGITYEIMLVGSDGILKAIVQEEADFGIVFFPSTDQRIRTLAQKTHPLHAIMAPDHPLAGARTLTLREASEYPLALPTPSHGISQVISGVAQEERIELSPRFVCNSVVSMREFAERYGALTLMPTFAVVPQLEKGELSAVPLSERRFQTTQVELIALRDRQLPKAVSELLTVLENGTSALSAPARPAPAPSEG